MPARIFITVSLLLLLLSCQEEKADSDDVAAAGRLIKIDSVGLNFHRWHIKVGDTVKVYYSAMMLSDENISMLRNADTNVIFVHHEYLNPVTKKIELQLNSVSMLY